MTTIEDGPWPSGINSLLDPLLIQQGSYQWGVNCINRGGRIQPRPAFRVAGDPNVDVAPAQGLAVFTPSTGTTHLVLARLGKLYFLPYPFYGKTWTELSGISFRDDGPIHLEVAVKATTTDADGNVQLTDPKFILMASDGVTRNAYWDGITAKHIEGPIFSWTKWIGNRLWGASGKKIHASDLLDPLSYNEESNVSSGGFFVLPDECTGLAATIDFSRLLAFTDSTTSTFQAGISDRTAWPTVQDFQKVLFPNIGCAAGRTPVNQYGMTWWMSHGGWIGLDTALQTYRSSRIHYSDQNMARSKSNLSPDISGACAGSYGNFLMVSVPSGDLHNYHTWVMDQGIVDTIEQITPPAWPSIWTGIRPVEIVTAVINGQSRCFAASNDLVIGDIGPRGNVWEMFINEPVDMGYDTSGRLANKDIPVLVETRLLGNSDIYKTFGYAELQFDEMDGIVQINASYAGRLSSYLEVLNKQVVATVDSLQYNEAFETNEDVMDRYLHQKRAIKTVAHTSPDNSPGVESTFTRNMDRAFSLIIKWTGRATLSKILVSLHDQGKEDNGKCEPDETTQRYIKPDGTGAVTNLAPVAPTIQGLSVSRFVSSSQSRWEEPIHTIVQTSLALP